MGERKINPLQRAAWLFKQAQKEAVGKAASTYLFWLLDTITTYKLSPADFGVDAGELDWFLDVNGISSLEDYVKMYEDYQRHFSP